MHQEYQRINNHADKAIVFVHGILGTPNHFAPFIPLIPESISVHNLLLDGHGSDVKAFSKTSMRIWEDQVRTTVEHLAQTHKEIYMVGHSLGSLLAIEAATNNPKITGLFLLAVPLKLFLKPKMAINSLKVYFNKIDPENEELVAAKACYGINGDKNPLHYIGWIPRFLELFSKIRKTRKLIQHVKIPCVACQSLKDEMVAKSAQAILIKNPAVSIVQLENSGHYYYEKNDLAHIKEMLIRFIS